MKGLCQLLFCLVTINSIWAQKDCRHSEYEEKLIGNYPELAKKFKAIQAYSSPNGQRNTQDGSLSAKRSVSETIIIPVIVHILYNKADENISDAQVVSQINVLNNDFRGVNPDKSKVPAWFLSLAADCGIEFRLAVVDPKGFFTNGIVRKRTNIQYFGMDDRVKSSAIGGDDPWDANQYLNIWVCNLAGGILGYASSPGTPLEKDGVVINHSAFGTIGTLSNAFSLGRTATHEIGHWLNLRHIWGDSYCGDDKVDDTPRQGFANKGCPGGKRFSCEGAANGDMYMNFMDLTDDACMNMFTKGQRERMRTLFEDGGPRQAILSSHGLDSVSKHPQTELPKATDVAEPKLAFYPNPVGDVITIQLKNTEKNSGINKQVFIYNHLGQPVLSEVMNAAQLSINTSKFKPGLYYIYLVEGSSRTILKFMKS